MLNKKLRLVILTFVFVMILFSGLVLAGDKPLNLENTDPEDGAQDIAVDVVIKLEFSSNVVNFKVKENNIKCFKLLDTEGNIIPVEIIMADDQLYREKRRDVKIKPLELLEENTYYTLIIKPAFMAKNGNNLGQAHYITFGTK